MQKGTSCDRPHRSVAMRSYPSPKVRGGDQERQAATAQKRPRGATPHLRSGVVAERSYPMSKERLRRRAERSYSTFKVRRGSREEIPLVQVRSSGCALLEQP